MEIRILAYSMQEKKLYMFTVKPRNLGALQYARANPKVAISQTRFGHITKWFKNSTIAG